MYQPAHFRIDDPVAQQALIAAHPLATLVVPTDAGLEINHLPLLHDAERGLLLGHVARANPVWQAAPRGDAVAVFHGPQAYVTPTWYPSKREHGKVVPTWNYAAVHVHGQLRWIDDEAWLHTLVSRLTEAHETAHAASLRAAGATPPPAWQVDDAPTDYLHTMRGAIVGLELAITRIEGKFKLSQNRPAADVDGVVDGLRARGDEASAALTTALRPLRR
ncbi:MAG TPA: FMN-binding negative transcriptional regulator [Methylibium sp.]|nr:FMN-binding negative transcriptional regulator [Methylibium sp.]